MTAPRKADSWRQGRSDYLIPVRIAYHTIVGLEWFVTELPPDEHKKTRRYTLNWMGPVDDMPSWEEMRQDIAWIERRTFYGGMAVPPDQDEELPDSILAGSPVSPDIIEGIVRVVHDPRGTQLEPGEILEEEWQMANPLDIPG